jgi:hypothetical protein
MYQIYNLFSITEGQYKLKFKKFLYNTVFFINLPYHPGADAKNFCDAKIGSKPYYTNVIILELLLRRCSTFLELYSAEMII